MEYLKVQKHGGSKSVTLPYRFCRKLGIQVGDSLSCSITIEGEIILKPVTDQKEKQCQPEQLSTFP
jgi:antitoxin component of MazEF toxin-antitoxin module